MFSVQVFLFLPKPSNMLAILGLLPLLLLFLFISSYYTGISVRIAATVTQDDGKPSVFPCMSWEDFAKPQKFQVEKVILRPLCVLKGFPPFLQSVILHDYFLRLIYKHHRLQLQRLGFKTTTFAGDLSFHYFIHTLHQIPRAAITKPTPAFTQV